MRFLVVPPSGVIASKKRVRESRSTRAPVFKGRSLYIHCALFILTNGIGRLCIKTVKQQIQCQQRAVVRETCNLLSVWVLACRHNSRVAPRTAKIVRYSDVDYII